MPSEILMPALSPTMEEGKLSKWLVKEGDEVSPGDIIAEIETDKATMDVEAVDEGTIARLLVPEGEASIPVNAPIALISGNGEAAPAPSATAVVDEKTTPEPEMVAKATNSRSPQSPSPEPTQAANSATSGDPPGSIESDLSGVAVVQTTMRDALRDAMAQEMRRDPDVFLMGEEVAQYQGAYKISQGLLDEFGDRRVIDTPITEQGFAGVGVGAAFADLKPIVEFMTWNFAMQAIDQIINSAAKTRYMSGGQMQAPIVFRGPNGAASRVGAQHSQCYSAWYAHCPGLKVVAPSTPADAKGLLKSAIRDPNPVVFLENELLYGIAGPVPEVDEWLVPIGKARVARTGDDVTIVSFARGMIYAQEAADSLAKDGISAEVIDLRTLRPLDMDTILTSVAKTHRLVTVEEAWPVCSVGSEICAQVAMQAFDDLDAPPRKVSGADVPMPYAANLEKLALPSAEDVVMAAKAVLYR